MAEILPPAKVVDSLGRVPFLSSILRILARRYREGSMVRINNGLAAGMYFKRYHCFVNSYWIGTYELPIQETLAREILEGWTVYDIGANAGFFTLILSKLVGPHGKVFAFEPIPRNADAIEQQMAINHLANCTLIRKAISNQAGPAVMKGCDAAAMGHLTDNSFVGEKMAVECTTMDLFVKEHPAPQFIKVDVEGAENMVLEGSAELNHKNRPIWLVELHSREVAMQVIEKLKKAEYGIAMIESKRQDHSEFPSHILARPVNS